MWRVFMIAIGAQHEELAALTKPIAEETLGQSVELVTTGRNPYAEKLLVGSRLDEGEHAILIDADVVLNVRPELSEDQINITPHAPGIFTSSNRDVVPGGPILHTGFFTLPFGARAIGAHAAELMAGELNGRAFFDEVPFTVACNRLGANVNLLPSETLILLHPDLMLRSRKRNYHFVGPNKLKRIRTYLSQGVNP